MSTGCFASRALLSSLQIIKKRSGARRIQKSNRRASARASQITCRAKNRPDTLPRHVFPTARIARATAAYHGRILLKFVARAYRSALGRTYGNTKRGTTIAKQKSILHGRLIKDCRATFQRELLRQDALKEQVMNWDIIQGKWKEIKGQAKEKWGKLTDDDLDMIEGKRDQLVGRVQQKYGVAKDEAERQVKQFETACHCD
jgi:uncharacterized protein YjbJ (UPF0337 family)